MIPKLSKELVEALHANGNRGLEVVDPINNRTYFLVDGDVHRQAMNALQTQQSRELIAKAISEMESGAGIPIDDAFDQIRAELDLPHEYHRPVD